MGDHRIVRDPHDREENAEQNRDDHHHGGQPDRREEARQDDAREQILPDDVPLEVGIGRHRRDHARAEEKDDRSGDPSARMASRHHDEIIVLSTVAASEAFWGVALPPKCPELNPVENVWQFMRDNWLSNRIFKSYDDLVDHCCEAWNKLVDQPWRIMSIGLRQWAHGF